MTTTRRDLVLNWLFYFAMLGLLLALIGVVVAVFANGHLGGVIGLTGLLIFTLAFLLADAL